VIPAIADVPHDVGCLGAGTRGHDPEKTTRWKKHTTVSALDGPFR
jgi:hypothetical protein